MSEAIELRVHALSNSDALGYLGQQAVAEAADEGSDYLIIGGHMVRLLLQVYPAQNATLRSTLDADAAVGDVEVVGPISANLLAQDFTKEGGNVFAKAVSHDQRVEINLLLAREGAAPGLRRQDVPGVGQVDTLPELRFALMQPPLSLEVTAMLRDGRSIEYETRIPDLEAATVLKAHSWKGRRTASDLADLHSLFEIREAHPEILWRLDEQRLMGFRKDTARILYGLAEKITRKHTGFLVPGYIDRLRMAGLIAKHVSRP